MYILRVTVRAVGADGSSAEIQAEIHNASGPGDAADAVAEHLEAAREGLARAGGASGPAPQPSRPGGGRPPSAARRDFGEGIDDAGDGERAPETGKELFQWAGDRDLKNELFRLGKSWRIPGKVLDWNRDDVAAAYNDLQRQLSDKARNGRRNGYAGARN